MDNTVVQLQVPQPELSESGEALQTGVVQAKPPKEPIMVPTPQENIDYASALLGQLRDHAKEYDWMLAHFIEVAYMHAVDLRRDPTKMRRHRK
jgi:hypothetical protein